MEHNGVLIAGAWRPAHRTVEVENPATLKPAGRTGLADGSDVDAAVLAAREAFGDWSTMRPAERADHLDRLVACLRERVDDLVAVTVAEVGSPVSMARTWQVDICLDVLSSAADHARKIADERQGNLTLLRRPVGVAALITPWNYPLYQLAAKVGAALAAGCTVVHKPSELTPLSAYLFAEATLEAELPAGVFNLLPGTGEQVGAPLVAHPGVDVVSFTGSTNVGRQVASSAAERLARVSLELGGKSASVVTDATDLERAVRATVESCMLNTGQTCSALTRLLVPSDRLEEAVRVAADHADAMIVGDPTDPGTELGPLVSADQLRRVKVIVDEAVGRGARAATTNTTVPDIGHYMRPVVLTDVTPSDPVSRDEVFGPVLVVHGVDDDEHALRLANDSSYGLAAAVWCDDEDRARALAARLDVGQVLINDADFDVEAPFGGWKQSGIGRELGPEGLHEFTELTTVLT